MFKRERTRCQICLNDEFSRYSDRICTRVRDLGLDFTYKCSICGNYKVIGVAKFQLPMNDLQFAKYFWDTNQNHHVPAVVVNCWQEIWSAESDDQLPKEIRLIIKKIRSAVSHKFKLVTLSGHMNFIRGNENLFALFEKAELPDIRDQRTAIIYYIGVESSKTGGSIPNLPVDFHSTIGALNRDSALDLVEQLIDEKLVDCKISNSVTMEDYQEFHLTSKGWTEFENLSVSTPNFDLNFKSQQAMTSAGGY